jgi:hypothetical protein
MIEEIDVGQRFGELTVIDILECGKIHCECSCGRELRTIARELVQGNRARCKQCDLQLSEGNQLTVDLVELEGLSEKLKIRILRAYTEHLRACKTVGTLPTSFAIFVREFKADPDSETDAPAMSFEERLTLSNPQRYRVYDRPKEMV